MEQVVKHFGKIIRKVCMVSALVASACVLFLILWGMLGISARYIFNYAMAGQYEASSLLLVLIVYLSIAYTQLEGGHIRMALFISKIKGRRREVIEALELFLCLIPSGILLWQTAKEGISSFKRGEFQMGLYSFPEWPSRLALPVGFLLLCSCLVFQIWKHLKSSKNPRCGAGNQFKSNKEKGIG